MTGTTISHFRVLEKIGAGGMGEVYLAEDTKLDRQVALKVLPPHALASEDDRARFYREARAAAALNHANIGHVYEIDEAMLESGETRPFIAMEYVDGESLAERITRGPLTLSDVIAIGSQIASGLAAAHAKNIVHRDIKPGNVMLTKTGEAKILDFGLAKTAASTKLTRMGSTLGTFAYMSPEQARGEEVDARTDVWSLGAVLYEMITGRVPFPGEYEQAVVYGILNEEPEPPTALRTGVPMELERIVTKCLSKDRRHRYQHVDEVGVDLHGTDPASGEVPSAARSRQATHVPFLDRALRRPMALLGLAGAVVLALAFFLGRLSANATDQSDHGPILRTSVMLRPGQTFGTITNSLAISRDGTLIAYAAEDSGTGISRIYLRSLSSGSTTVIPDSEDGTAPFFSPTGDRVGYVARGITFAHDIGSGSTQELGATGELSDGASWVVDNTIYHESGGIIVRMLLSSVSVEMKRIEVERGKAPFGNVRNPQFLSAANSVLFSDWNWAQASGVILNLDLKEGTIDTLLTDGTAAQVAGERLWFIREGALYSVPIDVRRVTLTGEPVLVQADVRGTFRGHYLYAVSDNHTVVYVPAQQERSTGVWVTREGREIPVGERGIKPALGLGWPSISPGGDRVAITKRTGVDWTLWMYDFRADRETQLTFGTVGIDGDIPIWAPDNEYIVYQTILESGDYETRRKRLDGTRDAETVTKLGYGLGSFSPDGKHITFRSSNESGGESISIYSLDSDSIYVLLNGGRSDMSVGGFSPDGNWITYSSNESGNFEIYVTDFPDGTFKRRISENGGTGPRWSQVGNELFYQQGRWMVAVKYSSEPMFDWSTPDYLFQRYREDPRPVAHYDIDRSGQKFFMSKRVGGGPFQAIDVIQNATGTMR